MGKHNTTNIGLRQMDRLERFIERRLPKFETIEMAEQKREQILRAFRACGIDSSLYQRLKRCGKGRMPQPCNIVGCPLCDRTNRALQSFNNRKLFKRVIKHGGVVRALTIIPPNCAYTGEELVRLNWQTLKGRLYRWLLRHTKDHEVWLRVGVDVNFDTRLQKYQLHFHGCVAAPKPIQVKRMRRNFKKAKGYTPRSIQLKKIHSMASWLTYTAKSVFNTNGEGFKLSANQGHREVVIRTFLANLTHRNRFIEVGGRKSSRKARWTSGGIKEVSACQRNIMQY